MRWLDGITESMGMSLSLSRLQEFEFEHTEMSPLEPRTFPTD